MISLTGLRNDIASQSHPEKVPLYQRFFKTGKGQYGEGDIFVGLSVPESRTIAHAYAALPFSDSAKLLTSKIHEERLIALLILVHNFKKGNNSEQKKIVDFYLSHTKYINNWDLVDLSAPNIISMYLIDKPRDILYTLAKSDNLWEKRIAIIGTFAFITKKQEYTDTFAICELLIKDKHDLIHKACGWMLREVGKRISQETEEQFLKKHYKKMPRTMLRYAIERFPEQRRQQYLKGEI